MQHPLRCQPFRFDALPVLFPFWMVPYVSLICFACVAGFAVRDFRDLDYDLCFAYVISYQFCLFCEHFWMRRILPRFNGKRRRSINRCRLICARRYRSKKNLRRRHSTNRRQRAIRIMFVFLCILCGCNAVSLTHDVWTHSAKQRNKLLHALHGNGGPNSFKGKGKGRSKNQRDNSSSSTGPNVPVSFPIELSDQDIASQVRALVPEAAHRRAQTRLEADEWDAPVYDHQALTKQGGISIAPKNSIAEIVQRIGYTTNPVALVVTEPPEALGLRGYPRKKVTCTVSYINDQGERSTTQVQKFLIQLGFGAEVSQTFQGPKVQIMTTMRPMIAKFPPRHHWPTGQIPPSTVAQEVEQHIPRHAFDDIISRESQSAALLVHMDYINALLRASGVNGAFYKLRMSEQNHQWNFCGSLTNLTFPEH